MITYIVDDKNAIIVKSGRKTIGKIKKVQGGYQYFPLGKKIGGDVFPSIVGCKNSLESD